MAAGMAHDFLSSTNHVKGCRPKQKTVICLCTGFLACRSGQSQSVYHDEEGVFHFTTAVENGAIRQIWQCFDTAPPFPPPGTKLGEFFQDADGFTALDSNDSSVAYDSDHSGTYKRMRRNKPWKRNVARKLSWQHKIAVPLEKLQMYAFPGTTADASKFDVDMIRHTAIALRDGTRLPRNVTLLELDAAHCINSTDVLTFCPCGTYLIYNKDLVDIQPMLSVGALDVTNDRQSVLPRAWLQNVDLGKLPAHWSKAQCIQCPNPKCRSYNLLGATMCWSCLAHWIRLEHMSPSS